MQGWCPDLVVIGITFLAEQKTGSLLILGSCYFETKFWANGIIVHQPGFSGNSREFPLLNHHLGEMGRVRSRFNLTRKLVDTLGTLEFILDPHLNFLV